MRLSVRRALAIALAALAVGAAARADQEVVVSPGIASRATWYLQPGTDIVIWAHPRDEPLELAPPELLRVCEVMVVHAPDGAQVHVIARRLASAVTAPAEESDAPAGPASSGAPGGRRAIRAERPRSKPEEPAGTTTSADPAEAHASGPAARYREGWVAAPAGPAERVPLDLAYVYVPMPGRPGNFGNLCGLFYRMPEVASPEIAIDPAFLRKVTGE